ncbi:acyl carrier protein [Chloroflexota bacterium]
MSKNENIEETLKEIVLKITRKPDADFSSDTQFKDLEADSLDIVQILVALEDTFGIEIDDEEIRQVKNMGELVAYIQGKQAGG